MKRIYKYKLETTNVQEIEMPFGTQILTVQVQNGSPCIWAMVDMEVKTTKMYVFRIFGTGHPIEDDFSGKYIGTYQLNSGSLVFHVFQMN